MRKAKKQTQLKRLVVAISLVAMPLISFNSYAAGLGRITVQSALGQPLRAQLEITANKDEASSVVAQLASVDAFRLAGVDYTAALTSIRFSRTIKEDGARRYVEVTTDRPLNEPFIDMLVELSWASGRLVREYTFLLDPPELISKEMPVSAPVASGVGQSASSVSGQKSPDTAVPAGGAISKPSPAAPEPLARTLAPMKSSSAASSGSLQEREVRTGDTLGKIAREVKTEGVSLDQMLVALFRENPDAFDGNMNRMRAGKILRVPDAASAGQLDARDARKEVVAQASDWEAYRARVAARAALTQGKVAGTPQVTQGKLAPKVEESAPAVKAGSDKLAVSRTESGKEGAKDATKGRVGVLEEDLVARDRALKDANSRIADLEKNLNDLKKLAELKSQAGANAQKMADAGTMTPTLPVKPVEAPKVVEAPKPAEPVKVAEKAKVAELEQPVAVPAAAAPAKSAVVPTSASEAVTGTDATKPDAAKAAAPSPKPQPPKRVVPPPEPEPEPDFMEENGLLVAGGGGVLALLLGYLGFAAYRRKKAAAPVAESAAPLTEPSAAASSVFNDTTNASIAPTTVDNAAGQTSVLETVGAGAAASIDPLDEADTYLAFGKDSQAEEILLEALKETPSRWAVHVKLLEIYSARRSTKQFNTLAQDLREQTGATGGEWERAAEMGRALEPNNSMYAPVSEAAAPEVRAEKAPMDMESTMVFAAPPAVAPVAAIAAVAAVAAVAEESADHAAVLDFDLGLDEPAAAPAVQSASVATDGKDVSPLDFDLDLGDGSSADEASEVAIPVVASAAPAGLNIDFDLELPTPPAEQVVPVALEMELPLPEPDVAAVVASSEEHASALSLDLPDEPAVAPVEPVVVTQASPEAVPDFDFDLGESAAQPAAAQAAPMEVDLPLDPGENPEAATKLELALAYEEMGDRDGARELFQEVLAEGSAAQQEAARAKLDQLG